MPLLMASRRLMPFFPLTFQSNSGILLPIIYWLWDNSMYFLKFCQEKSQKNFCRKSTRYYILNPFAKISYLI